MKQLSLLGSPEPRVPSIEGLVYRPVFVSEDEEQRLLEQVDAQPWNELWRRRRQVYGASYGPSGNERRVAGSIPSWLEPLIATIVAEGFLRAPILNVVVNEYRPGEGIGMHLDYPGFERVAAVGLGAPVLLELEEASTGRRESLDVAPRSLWAMEGAARHEWRHGIAARKVDAVLGARRPRARRVSITFRSA